MAANKSIKPSNEEKDKFWESLAMCERSKPIVLATVEPYCEAYIPSSLNQDLLTMLSSLYSSDHLRLGYDSLLQLAHETSLSITPDQVKAAETKTRDHINSRLWFRLRAGRITASKFKSACCTDPVFPAKSLIMSVCYPELSTRFQNEATKWGCQHEDLALKIYPNTSRHDNMKVSKCGFFISIDHPYLRASPNGLVKCSCCGSGICEVTVCQYHALNIIIFMMFLKCPHCIDSIDSAAKDSINFGLVNCFA